MPPQAEEQPPLQLSPAVRRSTILIVATTILIDFVGFGVLIPVLPEMALRFILSHPAVKTTIPGMRKLPHVEANVAASDRGPLEADLLRQLRRHRWDRQPAEWSQ